MGTHASTSAGLRIGPQNISPKAGAAAVQTTTPARKHHPISKALIAEKDVNNSDFNLNPGLLELVFCVPLHLADESEVEAAARVDALFNNLQRPPLEQCEEILNAGYVVAYNALESGSFGAYLAGGGASSTLA